MDVAMQAAPDAPITLTVVCPAMGQTAPAALDDPRGYVIANNFLPLGLLRDPVRQVAFALEGDGYSPAVNFALLDPDGQPLYIGPVGRNRPQDSRI